VAAMAVAIVPATGMLVGRALGGRTRPDRIDS
jgi:hypothetical protein